MSSISASCQKQSAKAAPNATSEMMIRVRSSSRCSTSVRRSSKLTARARAKELSLVLGDYLALDLVGLGRALDLRLAVLLVVLARDRVLELPHPGPERLAQLREPLRPEDDQGDHEDDRY